MAEEAAPAPVEDTPDNESAPETPPEGEGTRADELDPEHLRTQGEVDWEKRYNDLYPEFTRKSQRLKEIEDQPASNPHLDELLANPETRQGLLRFLAEQEGYELPEDDEDEEGLEDGEEFRDPRVDELIAAREEDERKALVQEVTGHVEKLIGERGLELTDRQRQAVLREAWNDGQPDPETTEKVIDGWKADLEQYGDSLLKKYRKSKQAPSPPQPGSSGTPDIPITDSRARLARAQEVAAQVYGQS